MFFGGLASSCRYPRICNKKGKVETCVVFFVCIHPVFLEPDHPGSTIISHLHTKNSLRKAKMARDIPVEEKSHTKTFQSAADAQHQRLINLVAITKKSATDSKQYETQLQKLKSEADKLKKDKQQTLSKVTRMERYIEEAENIITLNLGSGVKALLEIAGKSLNAKFLKKVQQSGYDAVFFLALRELSCPFLCHGLLFLYVLGQAERQEGRVCVLCVPDGCSRKCRKVSRRSENAGERG